MVALQLFTLSALYANRTKRITQNLAEGATEGLSIEYTKFTGGLGFTSIYTAI